ncbi:MAG: peptidylprolyl isomerase [Planctomycetia bacterium]|nr:peptidylprolyl isomerase [Planctomycetia bacterium]
MIVAAPTRAEQAAPVVVARVAGEPIYAGEVAEELAAVLQGRKVEPDAKPRLQAEMLAQLIDRRLVLEYLKSHQLTVDPKLVDAQVEQTASQLKQRGTSLKAQLAAKGITEATLRSQLNWRLSWKDYLDRHVTTKVLQQYFDSHRRDYDGTEIRVSQILLPLPKPADAASLAAATTKAAALRQQIIDGKLTFAEAVAKQSIAPSKEHGGDIGFLTRRGQMPEPISAAAFALDKDRLSPPVVTQFGIHVLLATEVKPGTKTWRDSAAALKSAVVQQGFSRIAAAQRDQVPVEFTAAMAHLDPKTGRLVEPTAGR